MFYFGLSEMVVGFTYYGLSFCLMFVGCADLCIPALGLGGLFGACCC